MAREIYFVTGNQGKLAEFKRQIADLQQLEFDLPEIQSLDPHEIIQQKLEAARQHHRTGLLLVEDTSLELKCLNGLPGPLVKWFEKTIGLKGMAELVAKQGVTAATARSIIGLLDEQGETHFFEGGVEGDFVLPRGDQDFGWGPCFQLKGETRTFGEMSRQEKDSLGMRGKAIHKLLDYLRGGYGTDT